jgi:arsenate reductase-like glutaredoxin family protein
MSNNKVEDNNVIIELSEQSPDMASLIAKITSLSLAVETLRNENSHLLQELEDKESLLEDVVVSSLLPPCAESQSSSS